MDTTLGAVDRIKLGGDEGEGPVLLGVPFEGSGLGECGPLGI